MITKLIGGMGKYKDVAIMFTLGIVVFTWGIKQLESFISPVAFNQAIEQKILQAENRSKEFAEEKYAGIEKLFESRHSENMRAIGRLEKAVEGMRSEVRELYKDQRISTLPITRNNNKN